MTSSVLYIVQSTPWIAAGLLVGFFVGRSTVAAGVIIEAVQGEGDGMRESSTPKRKWRLTTNGVIAFVLVLLGTGTAVQSYVQSEATAKLTECQTAYANGFADALDARSKASGEAQDALDELLSTVAAITPTPEGRDQFSAALADYLTKRAEAKKTQKEHPYPPAPRDVCKEAG